MQMIIQTTTPNATFEEWLAETDSAGVTYETNLKNVTSSEALAQLIEDWFFDYRIGWNDPTKFWRYLKRNIENSQPGYFELLRIQPGYAEYDWLVTTYRERKLDHVGDSKTEKNETGSSNTTKTNNDTHNVESDLTTYNLTDTDASAIDTDVKTGGHDATHLDGEKTSTNAPKVAKVTTNGGHTSHWDGNKNIQAALPMSKKYSSFITEADLEEGKTPETQAGYFASRAGTDMPSTMDWSTATQQGQTYNKSYDVDKTTVTESYEYGDGVTGDVTTTKGNTADQDSVTYNSETDTHNIGGRTHTKTGTTDNARIAKDIGTGETVGSTTASGTTTGSDNATDKEIYTGQDGEIAGILEKAKQFILHSKAWDYMFHELEPLFLTDMEA